MQRVVILGAGPHAREIADLIGALNAARPRYELVGHVVDPEYGNAGTPVGDHAICGDFEWLAARADGLVGVCGVGTPQVKLALARRAHRAGLRFGTFVHPTSHLGPSVSLAPGTVVGAGCVLTRDLRLAEHVHVNAGCTLSHDGELGELVYLAPGVHLAGRVTVHEGAYVGIGACSIEDRTIGAWSIVGAGAAVVRDVPPNTTAVGVPARVIETRPAGWHEGVV